MSEHLNLCSAIYYTLYTWFDLNGIGELLDAKLGHSNVVDCFYVDGETSFASLASTGVGLNYNSHIITNGSSADKLSQ